jgi:hypothetical protein
MDDDQRKARQREIERNRDFFLNELPKLLPERRGKYALLRNEKIIGFFDTPNDAVTAARQFDDQMYSIQQVTDLPVNLGFFSYAVSLAATQ